MEDIPPNENWKHVKDLGELLDFPKIGRACKSIQRQLHGESISKAKLLPLDMVGIQPGKLELFSGVL